MRLNKNIIIILYFYNLLNIKVKYIILFILKIKNVLKRYIFYIMKFY